MVSFKKALSCLPCFGSSSSSVDASEAHRGASSDTSTQAVPSRQIETGKLPEGRLSRRSSFEMQIRESLERQRGSGPSTDRTINPNNTVADSNANRMLTHNRERLPEMPDAGHQLRTPMAGFRSDTQQLEIIQRYHGVPFFGTVDEEGGTVALTHAQSVLIASTKGVRRNIDAKTFDALCLAEEIHLIAKTAFSFGTGNKQIFLDRTGGENWVRVHMARAAIDAKFSSEPEPADEAMIAVTHRAGSCWEHAMVAYALASNSGIDRPVFAVYDEADDHTYVLIGDPWKDPPEKVVVVDPWLLTPIAHTLADSTFHFPLKDGVEIVAKHDPKNPQKTKPFSMESAWQQKKISTQDIAAYISTRNQQRQAMGMQPLPENFGPEFLNVITDNGENEDWIFDDRISIADSNIVYQDDHGRARTFNTLPLEYVQKYLNKNTVEA